MWRCESFRRMSVWKNLLFKLAVEEMAVTEGSDALVNRVAMVRREVTVFHALRLALIRLAEPVRRDQRVMGD